MTLILGHGAIILGIGLGCVVKQDGDIFNGLVAFRMLQEHTEQLLRVCTLY